MEQSQDKTIIAIQTLIDQIGVPDHLSIQRFWRKPKPSCNWCPSVTELVLSYHDLNITSYKNTKVLKFTIPNHDWTIAALTKLIPSTTFSDLGELELTIDAFKKYRTE